MRNAHLFLGAITGLIAMFILIAEAPAHEPGEELTTRGYCMTEEAVRQLIEAVVLDGEEGYNRVMDDSAINCVDPRHGVPDTPVIILKFYATAELQDGMEVTFYLIGDTDGNTAYIWLMESLIISGVET